MSNLLTTDFHIIQFFPRLVYKDRTLFIWINDSKEVNENENVRSNIFARTGQKRRRGRRGGILCLLCVVVASAYYSSRSASLSLFFLFFMTMRTSRYFVNADNYSTCRRQSDVFIAWILNCDICNHCSSSVGRGCIGSRCIGLTRCWQISMVQT